MEEAEGMKIKLSPETLKIVSPERKRKREEDYRRFEELCKDAEWHLAEAKRLRESLGR
jgi:hypothetical protein